MCDACKSGVCKLQRLNISPGFSADHLDYIKAQECKDPEGLRPKDPTAEFEFEATQKPENLAYLYFALSHTPENPIKSAAALNEAVRLYESVLAQYDDDAKLRAASSNDLCALANHAEILATIYKDRGELAAAKRVLLRALAFRQESQGPIHVDTAKTEYVLGICLQKMEDLEGAETYYKSAFAHEREAGHEASIARRCCNCNLGVSFPLIVLGESYADTGRSERALELIQMALAIAGRDCAACVERGTLAAAAMSLARLQCRLKDYAAAEAVIERLVSETERRMGRNHYLVGKALIFGASQARKPAKLIEPDARRGWAILEAMLGATHPDVGEELSFLWEFYSKAPHLDSNGAFNKLVFEWAQANKRPPPNMPPGAMERIIREQERIGDTKARLASKLEQRRREREERQRAEEERERARREAERAERAARDAADREAARGHVEGARWAPARKLLDALLRRSPDDFEARLLRIRCMAGAGQLEAAGREAERAERELAGSGAGADALHRVQEQRRHMAAELQRREEAKRREEEEARRRAEEQQRERERQAEQRLKEARMREEVRQAEHQRQQQEREEEARRAAGAAAAASEHLQLEEKARAQEQRRALKACHFFAAGFCRDGARCRYKHEAAGPAAPPEEAEPECAICLEPLAAGPPAAALSCRHRFHRPCLEKWRALSPNNGCPECRRHLDGPRRPTRPYRPPGLFPA
eukprot:tig00021127_g18843.t1